MMDVVMMTSEAAGVDSTDVLSAPHHVFLDSRAVAALASPLTRYPSLREATLATHLASTQGEVNSTNPSNTYLASDVPDSIFT